MLDKYTPLGISLCAEEYTNMEEKCCCNKKTIRSAEEKKTISIKINRIVGQLNGIQKMIDEDRYCDDVLIQLSAASNATKSLANYIIEKHMRSCVARELQNGNMEIIDEVIKLFRRF
jgi:DNA-binding FrmR family transcriptional regulator